MRELLAEFDRLTARGEPVGRGVVTSVWRSAPRPIGACLLATPSGTIVGSVSDGCVESAAAEQIAEAIERGVAKMVEFQVSDEAAKEAGLVSGGAMRILVEPRISPPLLEALRRSQGVVMATVIDEGELLGTGLLVHEDGVVHGPLAANSGVDPLTGAGGRWPEAIDEISRVALEALGNEQSHAQQISFGDDAEVNVFFEVYASTD